TAVAINAAAGCVWNITKTNDWITITSPTHGIGSSNFTYSITANPFPIQRSGYITVGSGGLFTLFKLTQRAVPCDPGVSPAITDRGYGSSTGVVSVADGQFCAWTIVNNNPAIAITAVNNTPVANNQVPTTIGDGNFGYALAANPNPVERIVTVMVGDPNGTMTPFSVRQGPVICQY